MNVGKSDGICKQCYFEDIEKSKRYLLGVMKDIISQEIEFLKIKQSQLDTIKNLLEDK